MTSVYKKLFHIKGFLLFSLIVGLTAVLTSTSFAREPIRTVTGTVTKVSDGDTIQVTTAERTKLRVRLYGIDAPETPNPTKKSLGSQNHGEAGWARLDSSK
jgi:endonuclease YncB( thermonuclease family)